jgi:hypothetical protein
VTSTGHVPNRTDTGRSAYRREAPRSERGRRERVREPSDHGVKAIATQLREARKRDSQRRDGTRLAHARCRLIRVTEWGLGSSRFTSPRISASRSTAQQAAVRYRTRKRWCQGERRKTREVGIDRARLHQPWSYGAGGRHRRPRARPQGSAIGHAPPAVSGESRCTARCIGTISAEAEAPNTRITSTRFSSANCGDRIEPLFELRICLTMRQRA